MIHPIAESLSDGHTWLRVADTGWNDPLDPSFAQRFGGRWNPRESFPTLYLNEDVATARLQIDRMLEGSPVGPEDLDDAYVLVEATLPRSQVAADGVNDAGLGALGLPASYPVDDNGQRIPWSVCRPIGASVHDLGLRGVHARSAATLDGSGRELAWFPARSTSRARPIGPPIPFEDWYWVAPRHSDRRM